MDMKLGNGTSEMNMQMYFYADCSATILFQAWKSHNCKEMFGSCMIVIIMAICYEGLRYIRNEINVWVKHRPKPKPSSRIDTANEDEVKLIQPENIFDKLSKKQLFILIHFLQSFLYFIQLGLGYFLMLISMTFNAWLFLSICIGGAVGFLCFNFKKWLIAAEEGVRSRTSEVNVTEGDHH